MLPALPDSYLGHVFKRIVDRPVDQLKLEIAECLKFLVITSATKGRRIAVTPRVDIIWHELILQTASYKMLCDALPGRRFLHLASISPDEYAERVGDVEFIREFVQWVPDYVQNFGGFDETRASMWTVTGFLRDEMSMSLDEINALGREEAAEVLLPEDSPWRTLSDDKVVDSFRP